MGTYFSGHWDSSKVGVIPRAIRDIYEVIELMTNHDVEVTCSFMELYQENLFDLLSHKPRDQTICEIREDGTKGIFINGLSERKVTTPDMATECLMEGGGARSVGATAMNVSSSRSHAIFTINIESYDRETKQTTKAKFHLVDLAGSERSKKTLATGTRFREGVKINQGLLALGNVISALGGGSTTGFISYRDSKLTRLLQDSLGGNSVTLMIACVSPADYNIEETLSTLRYADRAKKIKNKPVVNQDSNQTEIDELRETVQRLRAQLIDTSETNVCGSPCKREKSAKDNEIMTLKRQLKVLLSNVVQLTSIHLVEENFVKDLMVSLEKLRKLILDTCRAEFAIPDTKIFDEIEALVKAVNDVVKTYNEQRGSADKENMNDDIENVSSADDIIGNRKYEEYTSRQIDTLNKISTLDREMKIKLELLERKNMNAPMLNAEQYEHSVQEYKVKISEYEREIEELRAATENAGSAVRRDKNTTKISENRRQRIDQLEKEISEYRKKSKSLENTQRLQEQDKKRIEDLRKEIQEMKTARVRLVREQRAESDKYKRWISTRDKEINHLKEKDKKSQNEMKRMERLHEKQQVVLKRKVEEAKAINKRLHESLERSKKVKTIRLAKSTKSAAEKTEVIQTYIDHEIQVLFSNIDANITMQSLITDRGMLTERLSNLKATVNKTKEIEEEIIQLEEDLEMRNAQIADIRQKLVQTDLDLKLKQIPENFETIPEFKIAMSYILRALTDSREDFTNTKTKAEDLRAAFEASEDRVEHLTDEMHTMKESFSQARSEIEKYYEEKLTLLWKQQKSPDTMENGSAIDTELESLLTARTAEIDLLKTRVAELEHQLKASTRIANDKNKKNLNGTFTLKRQADGDADIVEEAFDYDSDEEFDFNDSFNDPEWRKTPAAKRTRSGRGTSSLLKESLTKALDYGLLSDICETSDSSQGTKRTLSGSTKCSCKGSCATKLCGCKKHGLFCSDTCKCSEACVNLPDGCKVSDDSGNNGSRAIKMEKENVESPVRETTK